jgi:hypothetical protein
VRGLFLLPLCAAAAGAIAGCQVYDPGLVNARDAGRDAGPPGPCGSRRPPPRPTGADTGGTDIAFALRQVVLDQGAGWVDIGFDVDGLCTRVPTLARECAAPDGADPPVDGNDGIDNVFGQLLFPTVSLVTPDLEETARAEQERGRGLPILRIFGWNGEPDDPRVDVHVVQAVFGAPGGPETTPPPPPMDPSTSLPTWNGDDWFWVRRDAFVGDDLTRPLLRDDNAYVAGGLVVVRLPDRIDVVFPAMDYGVLVRLTDAIAVGRISADRTTLEDVVVAGRWSVNDLLSTARNIGVCPGSAQYNILLNQLDHIADVRSTAGTGGPGTMCDAVSLGVGFTGTRMRVAGLADGVPLADLCAMMDGGMPDAGTSGDAGTSVDAGTPFDGG